MIIYSGYLDGVLPAFRIDKEKCEIFISTPAQNIFTQFVKFAIHGIGHDAFQVAALQIGIKTDAPPRLAILAPAVCEERMSISTMKAVPEVESPMSDDEAVQVIDEALEAVDEKLPPRKPGKPQEDDAGEEASDEAQELVTLPGGEHVTIEALPSKMVFEVPPGEDGETREVSGSTLIKEGLKVLQGKATYERDAQELKRQKEELYPHLQLVARMKADPEFVRHVQNYQTGIRHHDVDPELRFTDRELIQIQQADPERAARILQKRATWLEQEQ